MSALEDPQYYLFTGGGTVLKALEMGDARGLRTVAALMEERAETDFGDSEKRDAPKCARLKTCDCGPPERETARA
jgi:phosphoglycerate kinase